MHGLKKKLFKFKKGRLLVIISYSPSFGARNACLDRALDWIC